MKRQWVQDKMSSDLETTKKSLIKIAAGATKIFLPESIQDEKGSERLTGVIDKIVDLIKVEFPELNEAGRQGAAIVLASTWALSFLTKIEEIHALTKRENHE